MDCFIGGNRVTARVMGVVATLLVGDLAVAQQQQQQPQQGAVTSQPAATRPRWRQREPVTLYVDPAGDDANAGTQDKPFKTVQKGCDAVQAGDTLSINAGTYAEYVKLTRSGRYLGRPITITATPGHEVIIDGGRPLVPPAPRDPNAAPGANRRPNQGNLRNADAIFDTAGQDHLVIRGLTVRNGGFCGIRVGGSWQVDVEGCRTSDTPGSGIIVDKSGMVNVRDCEVTRACGGDGTAVFDDGSGEESISVKRSQDVAVERTHVHHSHHEGIDVKEGSKHVRVRDNHISHIQRQALYADAWDSPTFDVRFERNIVHDCMFGLVAGSETGGLLSDVWFVDNVVYDLKGPGMIVQDWGADPYANPLRDVYFLHNTVVNCGNGGQGGGWGSGMVFENDQAENVVVVNNIFANSPQDQMRVAKGKRPRSWTVRNNLVVGPTEAGVGEGTITADDAGFVDAAGGDFRLKPGSPAVDAGIALPSVSSGASSRRIAGPAADLGALEFDAAAAPPR